MSNPSFRPTEIQILRLKKSNTARHQSPLLCDSVLKLLTPHPWSALLMELVKNYQLSSWSIGGFLFKLKNNISRILMLLRTIINLSWSYSAMIGYKSYCSMTTSEATEAFGQLRNYGSTTTRCWPQFRNTEILNTEILNTEIQREIKIHHHSKQTTLARHS